jgi:hypothetical protein
MMLTIRDGHLALVLCVTALGGCSARAAPLPPPPAPNYAQSDTWAAWPGRASDADAVPPGVTAQPLADSEKADVFFIHPTTYLSDAAPNARYDEPGVIAVRIDHEVLRYQANAFNGCCRIYAPRYRQAAIGAFFEKDGAQADAAFELAYGDVRRAFDYYVEHENHGRPFILAGHSQGSLHVMRLLQERLAHQALLKHLVVAYEPGYALPLDIERLGIAVCRSATQTGCVIQWSSVKEGETPRKDMVRVWLDGRYQLVADRALVCVNPLSWALDGAAGPALNLGALPVVLAGTPLRATVPQLTGATCHGPVLWIAIPPGQRRGFSDALTATGDYHVFEYNLFWSNVRANAQERVQAWHALDNLARKAQQ